VPEMVFKYHTSMVPGNIKSPLGALERAAGFEYHTSMVPENIKSPLGALERAAGFEPANISLEG
jgi:hypothetical protein